MKQYLHNMLGVGMVLLVSGLLALVIWIVNRVLLF